MLAGLVLIGSSRGPNLLDPIFAFSPHGKQLPMNRSIFLPGKMWPCLLLTVTLIGTLVVALPSVSSQQLAPSVSRTEFSEVLESIIEGGVTIRSLPGIESYFITPRRAGYLPAQALIPYGDEFTRDDPSSIELNSPIALASYDVSSGATPLPDPIPARHVVRSSDDDEIALDSAGSELKSLDDYRAYFEEELKKAGENAELDEASKLQLTETVGKGIAAVESIKADSAKIPKFQAEIDAVPGKRQKYETEARNTKQNEAEKPLDDSLSLQALQAMVALKKTQQEKTTKRLEEVDRQREQRGNHLAELNTSKEETKSILAKSERVLTETDQADVLRYRAQDIHVRSLKKSLDRIQKELEKLEVTEPVLQPERDSLNKAKNLGERSISQIDQRIKELRRIETEKAAADAEQTALRTHPDLQQIAEENSELANARKDLAEETNRIDDVLAITKDQLRIIREDLNNAKTDLEDKGNSQSFGRALRRDLTSLPSLGQLNLKNQQAASRDRGLDILNRSLLKRINRIPDRIEQLASELADKPNAALLISSGEQLLRKQQEFISRLRADNEGLIGRLTALQNAQKELIKETREYRFFIDKNILWIQSAPQIGFSDLEESKQGLAEIADARQLKQSGRWILERFRQTPLILLGVLAALAFLFAIRGFLIRRLKKANSRTGLLRILPVLRSAILSIVLSAVWPGVVAAVAWVLYSPAEICTLKASTSLALSVVAPLLFLAQVLYRISLPDGLGSVHLQWSSEFCKAIGKLAYRIILFVLPFYCFTLMVDSFQQGAWSESLGRFAFLIAMAGLTYALVGAVQHLGTHLSEQQQFKNKLLWQWRAVWMGFIVLMPISLIVVSGLGWNYSAIQLGNRLLVMILTNCAVVSACFLLYRVACIGQHLVVERRRWQNARSGKNAADDGGLPIDDPDLDIEGVTSQVAGLARVVAVVSIGVIAWTLWSDVLPAARFLDEIQVGTTVVEVSVPGEDAEGVKQMVFKKELRIVTLADWMIFAAVLVVTFVLSRNIPGLLEVAILNRLPIDRGGRYAISVICRYILGIIGIIFACRQVGFSWSNVQWLVAAMGVGLGFGLQEIFANVVSGLIILLERPVRIGDFVTVNGQTGFVTRTQLRATTIIDYERREMIIPNKRFITDDVTNWTLTDSITRVAIPVGIAYGSDTTLAHDTLLGIAKSYPLAMDEPEPVAVFNGFGASTLDFELRIYIASRDIIAQVKHDLHMAIDREFRSREIEIAFPQQDIHIRSVDFGSTKLTETNDTNSASDGNMPAAIPPGENRAA